MRGGLLPPRVDSIPEHIRGGRWCVWKPVWSEKRQKFDKIPSNGNHNISTKKPEQWWSFIDAVSEYSLNPEKYGGIGKLVLPDEGLVYVDVDNITHGDLEQAAYKYQQEFSTYCEISPSGKGLRLVGTGSTPTDITKPVEIYAGKSPRFVTMTGLVIGRILPVKDIGSAATTFVKKHKRNSSTPPPADMPELLDPNADWPEITFEDGADRSAAVLGEANTLYLKGYTDAEVLTILWNSPDVSQMALDHWKNRTLEKLWKYVCLKARENRQSEADIGAYVDGFKERRENMKEGAQEPGIEKGVGRMREIDFADLMAKEFPPLHWNVDDLLPSGAMLFSGKPKKGKSFLAFMVAICISAGREVFGKKTNGGTVLYMGLEDSDRRLKLRGLACAKALGIRPDEFASRLSISTRCSSIDNGLIQELTDRMSRKPDTTLIIIDMLKKVTAVRQMSDLYKEQARVGDILTQFCHKHPNLSIIVVHHNNQGNAEDPFDQISGTTGLSGSYDQLAVITDNPDGTRSLHITGRDVEGAEIPLLMNDRGMYTLSIPTPEEMAKHGMSSTRRRVYDVIPLTEWMQRKEVVTLSGLKKGVVDQQLKKMKHDGLIVSGDRGEYRRSLAKFYDEPVYQPDL